MSTPRTYSFPDAKNIVVCGDIHGEFNAMIHKLCIQYQMTDTLLIVAGDCGFGFDRPGYYDYVFNRNSSRLGKANNWVVMLRGNHDNPAFFQEERIRHSRFRCIPDYSVIQACGHNILCVGGAVSIDRAYRKKHDAMHSHAGAASYWTDEMPVYDEAVLNNISKALKIDSVVTHTAPSSCELTSKDGLSYWTAFDPDIPADCDKERKIMDRILAYLKSAGHPVSHWYYGHFHQSWQSEIDGILFSMLDIMEFKEIR
ncbi:MAG: metallophosphoesterase [Bacteroidales bacterium]|nr:metallophosphoesterase [Bacteroidales bacterium]